MKTRNEIKMRLKERERREEKKEIERDKKNQRCCERD